MKPTLLYAIQLAGALHLFVACANFALPRILSYRENLAKVTPIIREIFLVHALYIVLVLVGIGLLCLFFPGDLAGASRLGRFLCGFLALFWSLRVVIQFFFYDRATKRDYDADALPSSSCFASLADSSRFFECGSIGYSVTCDAHRLDGLRLETHDWRARAFQVEQVSSSFFADTTRFPAGSVAFDHALIMRDIPHDWHQMPAKFTDVTR